MAYKRTKQNGVTQHYNDRTQKTTRSTTYGNSSNGGRRTFSMTSNGKQFTTETYKTSTGFIDRKIIRQPTATKLPKAKAFYKTPNIRSTGKINTRPIKLYKSTRKYRSQPGRRADRATMIFLLFVIVIATVYGFFS